MRVAAATSLRAAHPRVCGENISSRASIWSVCGSSPRVRGKPHGGERGDPRRGLIPACAGKTGSPRPACRHPRAHPRVCGENFICFAADVWAKGSSPRVRGKLEHVLRVTRHVGLIPACAGKAPGALWTRVLTPAHPRVCGENLPKGATSTSRDGSSPRVRGKLHLLRCRRVGEGLIPARAGKTRARPPRDAPCWAHPRVCGESPWRTMDTCSHAGSSPRVRGKLAEGGDEHVEGRLIPACAGKTSTRGAARRPCRAHPRVCGENTGEYAVTFPRPGSSPRVRGKRRIRRGLGRGVRLIPARAGKTSSRTRFPTAGRAHPRVCGENHGASSSEGVLQGSSPRVRGKPIRHRPPPARRRLIPACAGKTLGQHPCVALRPAHPRVCGENLTAENAVIPGEGSSPRVRGKRDHGLLRRGPPGLIPARAGKTSGGRAARRGGSAHPRACGENAVVVAYNKSEAGSSPRVRGKHLRGENVRLSNGSSPRVRGKPRFRVRNRLRPRLIPARAGKTP